MEEEGIVVELKGGSAVVKMEKGGCEGCGSAEICQSTGDDRLLDAENRAGASPGQRVTVDVDSGAFLKASLVVYMTPVLFLFLGAWLGGVYGPSIISGKSADFYQSIGGMTFLVLSIIAVRLYGKRTRTGNTVRPFLSRIVDR